MAVVEPRPTRVSCVWADLHVARPPPATHGGPHRGQALLLYRVWQGLRPQRPAHQTQQDSHRDVHVVGGWVGGCEDWMTITTWEGFKSHPLGTKKEYIILVMGLPGKCRPHTAPPSPPMYLYVMHSSGRRRNTTYKNHILVSHSPDLNGFLCPYCPLSFVVPRYQGALQLHAAVPCAP